MIMNTLDEIAIKYQTDKASTHHGYTKYYQRHFEELRHDRVLLIELGYGGYDYPDRGGAGARMWLEYFTTADVISIDVHKKINIPKTSRFEFWQYSQDDEGLSRILRERTNLPHIIIDDASHICDLTLKTFEILFPVLRSGGWYVIEDTETSFWDGWSKGTLYYNDFNFSHPVNLGRRLINDVNAKYIPNYTPSYKIDEIHFYQNIIFIKKK
jgi:hypothetical protein